MEPAGVITDNYPQGSRIRVNDMQGEARSCLRAEYPIPLAASSYRSSTNFLRAGKVHCERRQDRGRVH